MSLMSGLNNVADVTYLTLRNGKMELITAYAKASVQRASTGGDVTRHLNETQYIPGKQKSFIPSRRLQT